MSRFSRDLMTRRRSRAHSTNWSGSAREHGDGNTRPGIPALNAPFPNLSRRSRVPARKYDLLLGNKQQNQQNFTRETADLEHTKGTGGVSRRLVQPRRLYVGHATTT